MDKIKSIVEIIYVCCLCLLFGSLGFWSLASGIKSWIELIKGVRNDKSEVKENE